MSAEPQGRIATVERKTKETEVFVSLDLDGNGIFSIAGGAVSAFAGSQD